MKWVLMTRRKPNNSGYYFFKALKGVKGVLYCSKETKEDGEIILTSEFKRISVNEIMWLDEKDVEYEI